MGKGKDTEHATSVDALVAVDEICDAYHEAGQSLRQAALRILNEPSPMTSADFRLAGMALAGAEQLRLAAMALRIEFGAQDPARAALASTMVAPEKPKRTRGPRKPRASAAARTGVLPGTKLGEGEPSDDELERLTNPNVQQANGGAS